MERFATFVTGGGLALVAGLWIVSLFPAGSSPWLLGAVLSVLGAGGLLAGIRMELAFG